MKRDQVEKEVCDVKEEELKISGLEDLYRVILEQREEIRVPWARAHR